MRIIAKLDVKPPYVVMAVTSKDYVKWENQNHENTTPKGR